VIAPINPLLIYAYATGYREARPEVDRLGYDRDAIQALHERSAIL
jgi:crotonobetainyl-CoA:carnitine CoA-transferase CaiB-like acyl-CoA transferase